jgi:hypothetical protein
MSAARNRHSPFDPRSLYYRHSGEFSLAAAFLVLFAGSLAAALAAAAYAYLAFLLPAFLRILLTVALGIGLGMLTGTVLYRLKTRNSSVTGLIGIVLATIALGAAWLTWVDSYDAWTDAHAAADAPRHEATIAALLAHPGEMFASVIEVAKSGYFKIGPHAPAGIELVVYWTLEALILYVLIIWLPLRKVSSATFCERCRRWGTVKNLCRTAPTDAAPLVASIQSRKLAAITALGPPTHPQDYFQVSIDGCPTCNTTQTLCIDHISATGSKPKRTPVIRRFSLSPEEYVALGKAAQTLTTPATPANA